MEDFLKFASQYGVTGAILLALLFALWRILTWLKPWAEKLFAAHLAMINAVTETQQKHDESLKQIAVTQERLATNQDKQTELLVQLKNASVSSSRVLQNMNPEKPSG